MFIIPTTTGQIKLGCSMGSLTKKTQDLQNFFISTQVCREFYADYFGIKLFENSVVKKFFFAKKQKIAFFEKNRKIFSFFVLATHPFDLERKKIDRNVQLNELYKTDRLQNFQD